MDDESPWDDDPSYSTLKNTEWDKLASDFTNAGYREGITAGKESALQEGFDAGFAEIGVPLGREVGQARGMAVALLSIMEKYPATIDGPGNVGPETEAEEEVREMKRILYDVRLSDIVPVDEEAERHAREHLEEIGEKSGMEEVEDMLSGLGSSEKRARPTREHVQRITRLLTQKINR